MKQASEAGASSRWWVLAGLVLDALGLGTLIGMFMVPGIFLALPGGLLGQRLGEFPVLLFSLAAMVAGGAICALASDPVDLALGAIAAAAGGAVRGVQSR